MSRPATPLRFLALVVGGWIVVRGAYLGSEWLEQPGRGPPAIAGTAPIARRHYRVAAHFVRLEERSRAALPRVFGTHATHSAGKRPTNRPAVFVQLSLAAASAHEDVPAPASGHSSAAADVPLAAPFLIPVPAGSRWSGSAWLFAREGESHALAPAAGTLGGSQLGARLLYRLNRDRLRPLALAGRFYAPLHDLDQAEAALGIDWRPIAKLPMHVLAERRQAIGAEGRSAFSLLAYGGLSELPVAGPVRLDAYAEAGVVGVKSRDLFADGSARLSVPVERHRRITVGAGLWGAAQPAVERLDIGPVATLRILPRVSASAEWRFRIAGNARPTSGPALTLAADF